MRQFPPNNTMCFHPSPHTGKSPAPLRPAGSTASVLRTVTSGVPGERSPSPIGDTIISATLASRLSTSSTAGLGIRISLRPPAAEEAVPDAGAPVGQQMRKASVGAGRRKSSLKANVKPSPSNDTAEPRPKRQNSAKNKADDTPVPKRQNSAKNNKTDDAPQLQQKASAGAGGLQKRKSSAKGQNKATDVVKRPSKRTKPNGVEPSADAPRTTINALNSPASAGPSAPGSSSAWAGGQLPINALLAQVANAGIPPEALMNMQQKDYINLLTMLASANASARQAVPHTRPSASAQPSSMAPVRQEADGTTEAALALQSSAGLAGAASAERNAHPVGLDLGEPIKATGELSLWSGKVWCTSTSTYYYCVDAVHISRSLLFFTTVCNVQIKHRHDNSTVELMCCTLLMPTHLLEHFPPTIFVSSLTKRNAIKLGRHYALRCSVPFVTQAQASKLARLENMGQLAVCHLQHCQLVLVPVSSEHNKGGRVAMHAFLAV